MFLFCPNIDDFLRSHQTCFSGDMEKDGSSEKAVDLAVGIGKNHMFLEKNFFSSYGEVAGCRPMEKSRNGPRRTAQGTREKNK
jgi:hypothetical protein